MFEEERQRILEATGSTLVAVEHIGSTFVPGLAATKKIIDIMAAVERLDDAPQRVFTLDRTAMTVDYFVKWRIDDEVVFYTSTGGSQNFARDRLREIIKNSIVTEFGKRSIQEAISLERVELMQVMLSTASATAAGIGVKLVDFRVKQVEFVDVVRNSVYNQMREERARVAAETRAEGREAAELITSTADRDRTVLLAEAYRDGQIIRGEGDARAADIYASAYTKDPEFYAFYRSIEASRNALGKAGDILVLDPNNEFFRYLNQSDGKQ